MLGSATGQVRAVAFGPPGSPLATADSDGAVILRDPATGSPTHRLPAHTGPILAVAFSPRGGVLATAGNDATVRLWDLPVDAG